MSEVAVSERFVEVPGGTVYAKRWTPTASRNTVPVILFHDSIGCVEMWRQFPKALADRLLRPVIAYDRLGFGRSSARRDIPSLRFVSEEAEIYVPAILRELRIQSFVAFGHSVGGSMAVVVASCTQGCDAVITESAQAFVEPLTLESIASAKERFQDPQELAKLERFHGEKALWVVDAWTGVWLTPEWLNWNIRTELSQVRCPLLAIHGDRDEYGSNAFAEALSGGTKGTAEKLILEGCGHVPHRERERPVLNALDDFLQRTIGR